MSQRRPWIDLGIVVLLALMLGTGLPRWIPGVRAVDRLVDPLADVTGLQQSGWQLFAPEPDRMNAWIDAEVTFDDGSTTTVPSPDWRDRSLGRKFVEGRLPKILEYVRRDDWQTLWGPYVDIAARKAARAHPGRTVVEVKLVRRWWNIPAPEKRAAALARFGELPPPRDAYPQSYTYYAWRARE